MRRGRRPEGAASASTGHTPTADDLLGDVATALADIEAEGAFATRLACDSDELRIRIDGVGPLRFPISVAAVQKLRAVARAAPFGRRGETLHDTSVRDTWEIAPARIRIDAPRWQRILEPALAVIRQRLGLPEGGTLEAVLDKLLVYGPGQFFAPHQDSERADDMVASLIVQLPSRHQGGALVVEHRGQKKVFRHAVRGANALSLCAFYADCHHEVKPVASGHRIVLTHQLLHREAARERPSNAPAPAHLMASVRMYFATPVARRYSASPPERPDRLVYLLDHEYTQKSLAWNRLKNADRLRAGALAQVAERLDCEAYLVLADVHENWSCEEDDDFGYGRRRWRGERRFYGGSDDEDVDIDEDDDAQQYTLLKLLEREIELRHWVALDGSIAHRMFARPASDEVCFTRPSTEMDPFQSEHEGYMGNYGNTVDRWYHRAAVVMWPRERAFVLRAKASPPGRSVSLRRGSKAVPSMKHAAARRSSCRSGAVGSNRRRARRSSASCSRSRRRWTTPSLPMACSRPWGRTG